MIQIGCSQEFASYCSDFRLAVIECTISANTYTNGLNKSIKDISDWVRQEFDLASWKSRTSIASTRTAYKKCGKDPNRYRPSSEQLGRRLLNGMDLYRVNAIVDWGNLLSLYTGFSVGVFDSSKLSTTNIKLRLGTESDLYEGIGRGLLNIDRLPTYQDSLGAFATPTSDSERTKIDEQTQNILVFINDFSNEAGLLEEAITYAKQTLSNFFSIQAMSSQIITPLVI